MACSALISSFCCKNQTGLCYCHAAQLGWAWLFCLCNHWLTMKRAILAGTRKYKPHFAGNCQVHVSQEGYRQGVREREKAVSRHSGSWVLVYPLHLKSSQNCCFLSFSSVHSGSASFGFCFFLVLQLKTGLYVPPACVGGRKGEHNGRLCEVSYNVPLTPSRGINIVLAIGNRLQTGKIGSRVSLFLRLKHS